MKPNPRALPPDFGTSAEVWAGLQADYDLRLARYQKQKEIESDVEPLAALHPALAWVTSISFFSGSQGFQDFGHARRSVIAQLIPFQQDPLTFQLF